MIEGLGKDGPKIKYIAISSGKMRRYFSWQNFLDFFRFFWGIHQAKIVLKKFGPKVVFSKGGFVSFPVTKAAKKLGIPVVLHESDVSPGLANRLAMKSADKICVSFEETKKYIAPKLLKRVLVTGNPVRESVLNGDKPRGYEFTGLMHKKPVILVIGGSSGAMQLNELVWGCLDKLLNKFQIVHLVGRGNLHKCFDKKGYAQFEYLDKELKDIYAISDLVISRGGANALFELALLGKKVLIIPLSHRASRGDQFDNAEVFVHKLGWGLLAGDIGKEDFIKTIERAIKEHPHKDATIINGAKKIAELILSYK
jgi:UDP-N-acetylglucosamine--N-acetylmuramyl-(pentapeptide) pyrophosphoryl-undecaprenol N-acetylglucosamine transferase